MTGIAVLGCGRIGVMHARNIARHPRATLASVYDVNTAAAAAIAAELGVPVAATAEEIFAAPDVDGIATSTDTHIGFVKAGVAANKPILCEKPIDLSLANVDACAREIAGTAVPIMLGFVRRFDPGHAAVREAVRSGRIGELHQVVVTSRDPGPAPESYLAVSGGIFRDMTIHDFDIARFVLGEEVASVFATGSRLVDPVTMAKLDDFDTVSIIMTTATGRQAIINNSRKAVYGYDQRLEAFGSGGMAISQNRRGNGAEFSGDGFTNTAAPLLDFFIERYREAFDAEIAACVDAIEGKGEPPVTFADGVAAQRLAEAAHISSREDRVVALSEVA